MVAAALVPAALLLLDPGHEALLMLVLAAAPLLRLLSPRLLLSLLAMFLGENFSRGGGRKATGCRHFPRFCNPTKLGSGHRSAKVTKCIISLRASFRFLRLPRVPLTLPTAPIAEKKSPHGAWRFIFR